MSLPSYGYVLKLSAYLLREAAGLGDEEPVVLTVGAEAVRKMALAAKNERDVFIEMISNRDRKLGVHLEDGTERE